MDSIQRYKTLQQQVKQPEIYGGNTVDAGSVREMVDQTQANLISELQAIDRARASNASEQQFEISQGESQGSILPSSAPVTQSFGNYNPELYAGINQSMKNTGTDFGIKEGTPLALPPGEWEVLEAYSGAGRGSKGDKTNRGYGNSVMVRNRQTGEILRYSHLSGVNVQQGGIVKGGTVIGASGASGNITGPHLDLEYKDARGQLQDVMKSPYATNLFGS